MLKRQSTVGFPGANISDQSQACETKSCLFLYLCSEVEVCTDIYTAHHCCFCITFKKTASCTSFPSHTEGRTKSILSLLTYYSRLLRIDYILLLYCCTDAGVPGANIGDQSRACETRLCLFLCPCIGVDICTDIHTEYSTRCVALHHFQNSASCTPFPSHTVGPY